MDAFIEAYFAIDKDACGEITSADLVAYMKKNNYDDAFVDKWLKIFDKDNSGTITLEEYCDVLGLEAATVKAKYQKSGNKSLPSDVQLISADMEMDRMLFILDVVREGMHMEKEADMAKFIKQQCDATLERLWHCVIIRGDYWSYVSHEPGCSFNFKLGKYVFLIWRTPGY